MTLVIHSTQAPALFRNKCFFVSFYKPTDKYMKRSRQKQMTNKELPHRTFCRTMAESVRKSLTICHIPASARQVPTFWQGNCCACVIL